MAYLEPATDWFPGISTVVNIMELVIKGVLWAAEGRWKPSENTAPFIHHVAKKDIWSRSLPGLVPVFGNFYIIRENLRSYLEHRKDPSTSSNLNKKTSRPYAGKMQEMKELRKSYCANLEEELKRLRDKNILTHSIEQEIEKNYNNKNNTNYEEIEKCYDKETRIRCERFDKKRINYLKWAIGRTLEIKRLYGNSHYVFTSGQAAGWSAVSHLIKELVRHNYSKEEIASFKFVRMPKAKREYVVNYGSNPKVNDHDPKYRAELISADAYLLSNKTAESAIDFFISNSSNAGAENTMEKAAEQVINELFSYAPARVKKALLKQCKDFFDAVYDKKLVGNLQVFCVPKSQIASPKTNFQYRSEPMGFKCKCSHTEGITDAFILDALQNEEWVLKHETSQIFCRGEQLEEGFDDEIPQYRLLTSQLRPEDGTAIYFLTPTFNEERRKFKRQIREVIQSARNSKST